MEISEVLEGMKYGTEYENNEVEKSVVYIPGISEVIHLVPRTFESDEEKKERKKRIAIRIAQSPTPEIVRNIGRVMTWFDDMGDAMTAGYWGGRGAIWLASKIGLKIATRAIPYVGWALLAKDIFDIVNFFGIPGKILGRAKRERWRDQRINPFGKKAKISRADKLVKKVPGFGDVLEILQTTDNLFGVGISFGPLIGFAEDIVFGALKGAEIRPGWSKKYDPVNAIIRGLESGAFVASFGQEFSEDDHIMSIAAIGNGFENAMDEIMGRFNMIMSIENWDIPIYPRPVGDPITREVLKELGFNPDECNRFPFPGEPEKLTANEIVKIISDRAPKCLKHWLVPLRMNKKGMVAGEIINSVVEKSFQAYEGYDISFYETHDEIGRIIHDILDGNIEYPWDKSQDDQIKWIVEEGKRRGLEL